MVLLLLLVVLLTIPKQGIILNSFYTKIITTYITSSPKS